VEVSFGSQCTFRCAYCNPYTSSSIWTHYEKFGPYVGRESLESLEAGGKKPYGKDEKNPYVDAFWKWFPEGSKDLKIFRITGGEPLVNPNTFLVLDYLEKNPAPHLELCINSNLGVHDKFIDVMLEKVARLTKDKKIGSFNFFTSIDTFGPQAGYLRTGLNYEKWRKNVLKYLEALPWNITFMCTYNLLSPPKFNELLTDLNEINRSTLGTGANPIKKRTYLDVSHLTHPEYFAANILTPEWREKIVESAGFMESLAEEKIGASGYQQFEVHKLGRIASWVNSSDWENPKAKLSRGEFYTFTQQFEQREKVAFLSVFPEMAEFLAQCERDLKG
jgi:organic radical activating enzyme